MSHELLTRRLRTFAGTEFAQAALSRSLSPEFSRARLLDELSRAKAYFPETPLRERIFGEPSFLREGGAAEFRIREWELSRNALLAVIRGLEGQGVDLASAPSSVRYSFAHTGDVALAVVVSGHDVRGFGVDLEPENREISDAAFARFHRVPELTWLADRLDHWILKEACYKAHPRSAETIVADYEVTGRDPAKGEFTIRCLKGVPENFRAAVGSIEGYRYAFAEALE